MFAKAEANSPAGKAVSYQNINIPSVKLTPPGPTPDMVRQMNTVRQLEVQAKINAATYQVPAVTRPPVIYQDGSRR
jgi:hypothetical protein